MHKTRQRLQDRRQPLPGFCWFGLLAVVVEAEVSDEAFAHDVAESVF
jgi:hypothetical protein